jgi:integrase
MIEPNERAAETKRRGRKRGHGEGSIRQLPDGRWKGELMVGYKPDGKRDVRVAYGKTRKQCQSRLDELKQRRGQGLLTEAGKERETLAAYLDRWLAAIKGAVRPSNLDRYTRLVTLHIKPKLGHYKLSALMPDAIQTFYTAKQESGLSPTTVQLLHTTLHKALADAVDWGYRAYNPADRVRRPQRAHFEAAPPTPEGLGELLRTAEERGDRLMALWTVTADTGARLGELLALKWPDVDLDRGTVSFRRNLRGVRGGEPIFDDLKTDASRRVLSIPDESVASLRAHHDRQNFERQKLGDAYRDHGLIFATALGTALGERNVIRAFKAALRRAGLRDDIRLHDLRHAHGTTLAEDGVNLKVISARLGHASIQITANFYLHPGQDADRDAAERFARRVRGRRQR